MKREIELNDLFDILDKKYFSDKWLKFPRLKKDRDDFKDLVILSIISASTDILKYFHLFFLGGDYVILLNEKDDYLNDLEHYLLSKSEQIDNLTNGSIKFELQNIFQSNIFHPLRNLIKPSLVYFGRDLFIQLNLEYKQGLFRGDKNDNGDVDIDESVLEYMGSFKLLISLLNIEHFRYRLDNHIIRELLLIRKQMDLFTISSNLKEAISIKSSFLLRKLLYRAELSKSKNVSPDYIYSFDQQDDTILNLDNIGLDDSLDEWDTLIKTHYGISQNFKIEQRKRRREIENKNHSDYCYKDYHGLIKIYKDDTKNLEQSRNLLSLFDRKTTSNKSKFNNYSRSCTGAYLFNNHISLQCEIKSFKIEAFKELIYEVKNRQNNDEIRNYFPWYKLAQTLIKEIDKISSELIDPRKYIVFKEYLALFSTVVEKLEETVQWCVYKNFIPIQMPFNECLCNYVIKIDDFEDVRLFFFSSFVLPMDYNQISKDNSSISLKKQNYETLLTVYDKLQYLVNEVEDVSEKMRKQERRSIEVLAIFSAMALFSVGSIQIFSNKSVDNDPNVYYKFIMSFGYSLALFVLLIWIVTRDNIKKIQMYHWIIVGLLFIGTCIVIGYFVGSPFHKFIENFTK